MLTNKQLDVTRSQSSVQYQQCTMHNSYASQRRIYNNNNMHIMRWRLEYMYNAGRFNDQNYVNGTLAYATWYSFFYVCMFVVSLMIISCIVHSVGIKDKRAVPHAIEEKEHMLLFDANAMCTCAPLLIKLFCVLPYINWNIIPLPNVLNQDTYDIEIFVSWYWGQLYLICLLKKFLKCPF